MTDRELFDDIVRTYPHDALFMFETPIKNQTIKLPVYLLNRYIKKLQQEAEARGRIDELVHLSVTSSITSTKSVYANDEPMSLRDRITILQQQGDK